ncbi:MAG: MerR family transcriptional regulator [bacterium]
MAPRQPDMRYTIEEVSDLSGLKAHVLRYWESEFPQLKPERTRANQRLYRQKDLDLILHIKKLVHERGFTLVGARKQLDEDLREARQAGQLPLALDLGSAELAGVLMKARRQARSLLEYLEKSENSGEA